MPRVYVKKTDRNNIDEQRMKLAVKECLKNKVKISEAARQYGIKRTTLQSRIAKLLKKKPLERIIDSDSGNESEEEARFNSKYTVKQVLTMDQEEDLQNYIKKSSDLHYGLSYKQIRILAFQFAKSTHTSNIPDNWETNQMAGLFACT